MAKLNIWKSIKQYGRNSILLRNLFIILLVILVPFSTIGIISFGHIKHSLEKEHMVLMEEKLSRVSLVTDKFLKVLDRLTASIIQDVDIRKLILFDENNFNLSNEISITQATLARFTLSNDYISEIEVYSKINDIVISNVSIKSGNDWLNSESLILNRAPNHRMEINENDVDSSNSENIVVTSPIILSGSKIDGMIALHINMNKLFDSLGITFNDINEVLIIIDEDEKILLSSNRSYISKTLNEIFRDQRLDKYGYTKIDDIQYVVLKSSLKNQTSYVYMYHDIYYDITNKNITHFVIMLIIYIIILSFITAICLTLKTFQPYAEIIENINSISNLTQNNVDETEFIIRNILNIANINIALLEENNKKGNYLKQAQIRALQNQINPHFICNSLETIKWMLIEMGIKDSEAVEMIELLSDIFEYSIDMNSYLVDLRTELKNVQIYTRVLSIRYRNKLTIKWDIDERLLENKIVKLSLQPIIENAFYHGIKPTRKKGIINVKVCENKNKVNIIIHDNGVGMSPEKLEEVRNQLNEIKVFEGKNIGLNNVNIRTKLLLGEQYGIFIDSELTKGTTITLCIGLS